MREGLRALLSAQPDIRVVATAENGQRAIELYKEHRPDITIMDLKMPGIDGLKAVREIRCISPQARIIILTTFTGDEDIYQALQAGATTYLLKDSVVDNLVRVIRAVHNGARPIPEEIAARLAERIATPSLTRRELDVLGLIAKGYRNKEIAAELSIVEETVQVHVKNIMSKLNVHDRTEALTVAFRRGFLHLDF